MAASTGKFNVSVAVHACLFSVTAASLRDVGAYDVASPAARLVGLATLDLGDGALAPRSRRVRAAPRSLHGVALAPRRAAAASAASAAAAAAALVLPLGGGARRGLVRLRIRRPEGLPSH